MPELPEVETVRRVLEKSIVGLTIASVEIRYPNIIEEIDNFSKNVENKKIIGLSRFGKYLVFNLEDGNIVSHLRMEGKYFYLERGKLDNKHIHVIFHLSNGFDLLYQDVRKFGRMVYRNNEELLSKHPISNLGVDPILTKEIDLNTIYDKIRRKTIPIKSILLDQSIICGLGNIYVDEVLFKSKINPHKIGKDISLDSVKSIIENSRSILLLAIELKGTTIRSYTSSLGVSGGYQDYLLVHTKKECPVCKAALQKDSIGGRSTYYCQKCQV